MTFQPLVVDNRPTYAVREILKILGLSGIRGSDDSLNAIVSAVRANLVRMPHASAAKPWDLPEDSDKLQKLRKKLLPLLAQLGFVGEWELPEGVSGEPTICILGSRGEGQMIRMGHLHNLIWTGSLNGTTGKVLALFGSHRAAGPDEQFSKLALPETFRDIEEYQEGSDKPKRWHTEIEMMKTLAEFFGFDVRQPEWKSVKTIPVERGFLEASSRWKEADRMPEPGSHVIMVSHQPYCVLHHLQAQTFFADQCQVHTAGPKLSGCQPLRLMLDEFARALHHIMLSSR